MPDLEIIRARLDAYEGERKTEDKPRAAVAMLLREGRGPGPVRGDPAYGGPEVLLIERARREGDPWSGHMALPGGRLEPQDPHDRGAAERETLEEVGLSLAGADYLGRLDDLEGRPRGGLIISAHVYAVGSLPAPRINHEVQEAFWFPVRGLLDPVRVVQRRFGDRGTYSGIVVGEPDRHIVWGLTYRIFQIFFGVLGERFPSAPEPGR